MLLKHNNGVNDFYFDTKKIEYFRKEDKKIVINFQSANYIILSFDTEIAAQYTLDLLTQEYKCIDTIKTIEELINERN